MAKISKITYESVLSAVAELEGQGISPSQANIAKHLSASPNTVAPFLRQVREAGRSADVPEAVLLAFKAIWSEATKVAQADSADTVAALDAANAEVDALNTQLEEAQGVIEALKADAEKTAIKAKAEADDFQKRLDKALGDAKHCKFLHDEAATALRKEMAERQQVERELYTVRGKIEIYEKMLPNLDQGKDVKS